jgi:hypothetical protein
MYIERALTRNAQQTNGSTNSDSPAINQPMIVPTGQRGQDDLVYICRVRCERKLAAVRLKR